MNATRITDIVAPTGLAAYEALMVEARLALGDEPDKLKVASIFAKRVVLEHDPRIDWESELRVFRLFVEILHHPWTAEGASHVQDGLRRAPRPSRLILLVLACVTSPVLRRHRIAPHCQHLGLVTLVT